jgi:hypothetical protein
MSADTTVLRYSVRVSAYDNCDCRKTYEALWELCRVPESRAEANAAADELVALLAADGYTDVVSVRIDAYRAVFA